MMSIVDLCQYDNEQRGLKRLSTTVHTEAYTYTTDTTNGL